MPLSEFYSMASGSLESSQQKRTTFSTDLSDVPGNEFVELVWENGQIMMQGQSSRARKSSTSSNFQPQTPKPRDDKDIGNATISKMGKFGLMDSFSNGFATAVPSGGMGLDQDDDELVPWLNYPIDDSLQNDYCSELLPDLSGVTVNELLAQNSFASNDRRNGCNPTISGSHSLEHTNEPKVPSSEVGESSRWRNGQFYPLPFQESQTSFPSLRSGVSNITNNNTSNAKSGVCEDSNQALASAGGFLGIKIQKQDSGQPNTDSGIMNFSHFSRPAALAAALVRANLQNVGSVVTPGTSGIEGSREKNKETTPSSSNLAKPALINLIRGLRTEMGSQSQPNLVPPKVGSKLMMAKPLEESHSAQQSEAVCREDAVKNIGATASKGKPGGEKTAEPVASSSACSGNSAERASNSLTHYLRRKCRETDDSEGRSEDAEEESVGIRKTPHDQRGTTSKRSRAAEVHNLSERRRRDRINERMRALQELIPNCNKVDKASMLDEAIEYLKTLQLQVQIMSMGAGLYMPPMMLPTGMQHIHAAHMSRFSPMGMGVGMGIGMGMLDLNCGSPGCPMIPVAPIQGAHFPAPLSAPIFGSTNFQGMAGPNFPVFGHPGQGLPVSAPRAPLVPFLGGPPINSAMELNASGMAATVGVPNTAPSSNPKDLIQSANSQMMHHTDASSSMNQISNQCQATNEGLEQSSLVLKSDQAPDVGSSGDVSLTK